MANIDKIELFAEEHRSELLAVQAENERLRQQSQTLSETAVAAESNAEELRRRIENLLVDQSVVDASIIREDERKQTARLIASMAYSRGLWVFYENILSDFNVA